MAQPSPKRDSSPADLEFVALEERYALASWRNVCIAVWIEETPLEAVAEAQAEIERLALAWPEGVAFVQVLAEDNPPIEAPAREALRALLESGRGTLLEAPVVYEGSGFRAAAVRAIVTGLLSGRSYGFPHRVYSNIDEAALAVARAFERREPTRFAKLLSETLETLRDRHRRAFPTAPHSFIRYRG